MRISTTLLLAIGVVGAALAVDACAHHATSGVCPTGQSECGGVCVDTQSDPASCGGCNKPCTVTDPLCQAGACVATCTAGFAQCGGSCVSTTTDPNNCGDCGHKCAINQTCSASVCVAGPCRGVMCGTTCVDTTSDPANCGACGAACPVTAPFCIASACTATCPTGLSPCGNQCVDLQTDASSCGTCGHTCTSGVCGGGMCTCAGGQMTCGGGGFCVDTTENPNHCGSCNTQCNGTQFCTNSTCECRPGLVASPGGGCIDPSSNPQACGPSAMQCQGGTPNCQSGMCVATCTTPFQNCNNACVDFMTDPLHCGDCQTRCAVDEVCDRGQCQQYQSLPGCTTCPCANCGGGGGTFQSCCPYPGDPAQLVCVDAQMCP